MLRFIYIFIFLFSICISNAQERTIPEFERLIKYYRYYKQDSAIWFAEQAMQFAMQKKDDNGIATILLQMGMIDDNQGEFDSSQIKYKQAFEIFKSTGLRKGLASANIRLGVVELRNGKYDNAIKYFFDALKISEDAGDKFGIMEANYSISWAYLDRKNYDMALQYLKIAEQINETIPFSSLSLNIFNHMGVIYREKKDYKKAASYLEKGVKMSNDVENQGLNITLINNLASVYSKEGLKQEAIDLQKGALERSRIIGNYLRELQVLYGLSRTYGTENPEEAIFYLNQAILLAREKKAYNQEARYLKAITPLYLEISDYKNAYLSKDREHQVADSFYYNTMTKNMESLKAEYELSKSNAKVKELDLLNKKRELELEKATILRNVTITGLGLLFIILVLLYNQYRIKQRSNKKISEKNLSLQHLLDEKEWLLKEVHHRVKNNLHTIMSLLETQSSYLKDDALLAIQNSQHRVYAMSLIHQKLYQTENSSNINMSVYLPELLNYLRDSYDIRQRIRFVSDIEDIRLDISKAIPVGLILNEAVTNSVKYAFPENKSGEINIRMERLTKNKIRLSIADNGIGLPPNWDKVQKNSLGLKLMKGLTEDIRGKLLIENLNGTKVTVEFLEELFLYEPGKEKFKTLELQS